MWKKERFTLASFFFPPKENYYDDDDDDARPALSGCVTVLPHVEGKNSPSQDTAQKSLNGMAAEKPIKWNLITFLFS